MLRTEIRRGAYYDSVVLMHLQKALLALPGIEDAGVLMATEANKDVLEQSDLLTEEAKRAGAEDLIIVVDAASDALAAEALSQVDSLIERRRSTNGGSGSGYRHKTLQAAARDNPNARWVLISVPGRYAAEVARDALRLNKNIFLYSDNVSLEDELALKQEAAAKGLLVMGPDCGTALINGTGLGFANQVRRGGIGIVGASGTGLQHVTSRIHQLGSGVSHALGTGGRDLSGTIGATTARQALDLLNRDRETAVIVLLSKPPADDVADDLLRTARAACKPVIIHFIGYQPGHTGRKSSATDRIHFTNSLDATASLAVQLSDQHAGPNGFDGVASGRRFLRALYSGGTLAYEALYLLQEYLPAVYSNVSLDERFRLGRATASCEHTVVDLGADEFTVGRLHPMMDNELRIARLQQEAADPETALILLDVVLGHGAHPDPASELAPAVAEAIATAHRSDRKLKIVAVLVGTDEDPQDMGHQVEQLRRAGAAVETNHEEALRTVGKELQQQNRITHLAPVDLAAIGDPVVAINVGLESFKESLAAQNADVVHVDWRPSAGGNEKLAGILARMKSTHA